MSLKRFCAVLMAMALLICSINVPALAQSPSVTVMVYVCGADLEHWSGAASSDIKEMAVSGRSNNVNVIIETGGCKRWKIPQISATSNQRYRVADNQMQLLDEVKQSDMTDPDTLSAFIKFAAETYPADRNILVLWDHGGGALYGYGSDEYFGTNAMTIDEVDEALSDAGVYFDIIGLDACLMSTVETGLALSRHADYMIASQETEPSSGWFYTNWLNLLKQNPNVSSSELGQRIIDDYIYVCQQQNDQATLSMVDLRVLAQIDMNLLASFAQGTGNLVKGGSYAAVSKARSGAKAFGYDEYDHIDLIDLATRMQTNEGKALCKGIEQAIVYNGVTKNMGGAHGLSVYFPYHYPDALDSMLRIYKKIGWPSEYLDMIVSFANTMAGGQSVINTTSNPFEQTDPDTPSGYQGDSSDDLQSILDMFSSWLDEGWFDADTVQDTNQYVADNHLSGGSLELTEKNDGYVLSLSESDWDLINNIELQVYFDDGEGYIDLGSDDVYEFDDDGDLAINFDYTWVSLNGAIVPFYATDYTERDGYFCYTGYVPVELNGERMQLMLAWDSEHDGGYVMGARTPSSAGVIWRGLTQLEDGDVLQPVCDYYTYEGEFEDEYLLGDEIVVDGEITVDYSDIGDATAMVMYMLTDIYGNEYWTEAVEYYI